MELSIKAKTLIRSYEIRPARKLGQNFCVDADLIKRMIDYSEIDSKDVILEIGAGFGFLTKPLSEVAKEVIAVELDRRLASALKNELKDRKNVTVVEEDVLKIHPPHFDRIVATPPYSISTPLVVKILGWNFNSAVLVLQEDFVRKLTAHVGEKEYGRLTAMASYKAQVEVLETVPRKSFYPLPKVESTLIRLKMRKKSFEVADKAFFSDFLSFVFIQRNKKLRNAAFTFIRERFGIEEKEIRILAQGLPFLDTKVCKLAPEELGVVSNYIHQITVKTKKRIYKDHIFYVFPEVYEPSDDTYLLADNLKVKKGCEVLDIGTGCGILGILASDMADRVVAVEINPYAVRCAKINAEINDAAEKVEIRQGSLFEVVQPEEKFDLIIFNPPYLPINENEVGTEWLEKAWNGGPSGRDVIEKFLKDVSLHLREKGSILMIQSSLSDLTETVRKLEKIGFAVKILAEIKVNFEKIHLIQASLGDRTTSNKLDFEQS